MGFSFSKGDQMHTVEGGCVSAGFIVLGMIENNTYLVDDGEGGVIVVDPSTKPEAILAAAAGRPISALFVTHGHFDHVGALADLRNSQKVEVYASAIDAPLIERPKSGSNKMTAPPCPVDKRLSDGDTVKIAKTTWKVMVTPGHTKGGICYYADPATSPNPQGAPVLLSGDTLFYASIGRTDFEGGSQSDMRRSLARLEKLPDNTIVLPGHNMTTTIGAERSRVFDQYLRS